MGLRFRKSVSFGKFLRLNLSKSGASLGVGPRGLNVNFGPRGVGETVGIPGSGVYYQEASRWPKSAVGAAVDPSDGKAGSGLGWLIIIAMIVAVVVVVHLSSGPPVAGSKSEPANVSKAAAPQAQPVPYLPVPD